VEEKRLLNKVVIFAVGWFRNLSDFIKNILICFPKMNEGLAYLE